MNDAPVSVVDLVVPEALDGQRVDRALSLLTGLPRRVAAEALDAGRVSVDGQVVHTRSRPLRAGQRLRSTVAAPPEPRPAPDPGIAFSVVYEDSDLIVVDKPAGLVVHHGAGNHGGTLVDGLLARYPDLAELAETVGDPARPGIVHRLDKGTSGLLVVARSAAAWASLTDQLRLRRAERRYLALVAGLVDAQRGQVDAPIGRSSRRPDRMAVTSRGRPARTAYAVSRRYGQPAPTTLIEATLDTGRTHQVRVHMAAIGHPVIGDDRYGADRARPVEMVARLGRGRLFLHAWRLALEHPDGRRLSWESDLPRDLSGTLELLEPLPPAGARPAPEEADAVGSGGPQGGFDLGHGGQVL